MRRQSNGTSARRGKVTSLSRTVELAGLYVTGNQNARRQHSIIPLDSPELTRYHDVVDTSRRPTRPGEGREQTMPEFTVPPLPYDYAALEPTIDTETMHLHHDKHHAAYVT